MQDLWTKKYIHTGWDFANEGFPIASMHSLDLFNLPGLIHMPELSWPQALYIDREISTTSWIFLREFDECMTALEKNKLLLSITGFDVGMPWEGRS